jgi:site-specific DNA-methyltransferase (cytosine-N4-specific)
MSMNLDTVVCADALDYLRTLPDGSIDAVISDPPYAEIDRSYGRISEDTWHSLMQSVVLECRRVLKRQGSAMFVLQANYARVGKMRTWLWEFLVWAAHEWNLIQDAYWWNIAAMPAAGQSHGLLRASVKTCLWLGPENCYRNQHAVLWTPSQATLALKATDRALRYYPSGAKCRPGRIADTVARRGGSTPFNLLPIPNTNSTDSGGSHGHGAATPAPLVDWWIRYISPPNGIILDPFMGSGTTALVARQLGRHFLGCDVNAEYVALANERLAVPYTLPMFV